MKKSTCPSTTRLWTVVGGLALLASACTSSSSGGGTGGSSGPTGTGGAATSLGGASGLGGSGSGGSAAGGATGAGGSGTGGANTGVGGSPQDAAVDTAPQDARPDIIVHDGSTTDAGAYVRTGWTAAYTCTGGACPAQMSQDVGNVLANAFDGTLATRWSTGQFQSVLATMNRFPLYFTVDMGQVMNVSRITMHPGCQDSFDSPNTVEIFLAVEGTAIANAVFGAAAGPVHTVSGQVAACTGNPAPTAANGLDTITFPMAPARFIRIKATQRTNTDRYWAIGELNVFP